MAMKAFQARNTDDTNGSAFAFVDCSNPEQRKSAATKTLIHKHAMKEVGKSRRRPKPTTSVVLDLGPLEEQQLKIKDEVQRASSLSLAPPHWRGIGSMDPFIHFPIELNHQARKLVNFVFASDAKGIRRPLRDAWFDTALSDEAAFYQALANSALYHTMLERGYSRPTETPEIMNLLQKSMRSISKRLHDGSRDTQDGVIAAISALLCYYILLGDFDKFSLHRKGLQDVVKLAGGGEALDKKPFLRVTVSWCELPGVFQLDHVPMLSMPPQWESYLSPPPPETLPFPVTLTQRYHRFQMEFTPKGSLGWITLYKDLVVWSAISFQCPSPEMAQELPSACGPSGAWAVVMAHRLLEWRPCQSAELDSAAGAVLEVCRLGALLYLAPVWRFFGVHRLTGGILKNKLRAFLQEGGDGEWGECWDLRLWALYMGACESFVVEDREAAEWFCLQLAAWAHQHGLRCWAETRLWIEGMLLPEALLAEEDRKVGNEVESLLEGLREVEA